MPLQLKLPELEEDRRALGQTVVRGRDARGQPFLLIHSSSTQSRSPQVLIGAIDLEGGSSWELDFYQKHIEALVPYLCRFADMGRLHDALGERDGDPFGLFRLREGIGPRGGTWVRGSACGAVPFRLSTVAGRSPGQPLLLLSELMHDGDPRVKTLAFARGDIEALVPYLCHFIETGRLHDAHEEKEYVGVLLRRRAGRGVGVDRVCYHRACLVPLISSLPYGTFGEQWEAEQWITLGEARGSDYTCGWAGCGKSLSQPVG